jgi:uncharacterized membrane protein (DUF2068 family)
MAPMSDVEQPVPRARKQPFALVALAALMLLRAVLILLVVAGIALSEPRVAELLQLPDAFNEAENRALFATFVVPVAALLILSAVGLLAHRRRAWLLAMVMTGAFVAIDIVSFVGGTQSNIWMLLNIVTVFYLNQRDVRELVGDAVPEKPVGGRA